MELQQLILDKIKLSSKGIGFDEFMYLALYEQNKGYYTRNTAIFGANGDFITAPERSSLYAKAISHQIKQIMDLGEINSILEFGAGSGVFARDILNSLKQCSSLPASYTIIEKSQSLKQQQKKLLAESLPDYIENIIWTDLESINNFEGIILANEVFDALPFKRISIENSKVNEMLVNSDGVNFFWQPGKCDQQTERYINNYLPANCLNSHNYSTEVHITYQRLIDSITEKLTKGVMLIMDYGMSSSEYYMADRTTGTMRCFFKHNIHDNPFVNIGLQDITCDVDFTTLNKLTQKKFELLGYTTQANFLLGNEIHKLYEEMLSDYNVDELILASEMKSLLMPDDMGERFKVIAFGKGFNNQLNGFSFKDLRHTL